MSDQNKMTAPSIGHMFGMLLMRQKEEMTLEDVTKSLPLQNRVVEVMASNYEAVFGIVCKFITYQDILWTH